MARRRLRATEGSDEANVGTHRYPVERDGTVDVSEEDAETLLEGTGFEDVTDDGPQGLPAGLVRLRNASGSGCSWGGFPYDADENGTVVVPIAAEPDLAAHGFERVEVIAAPDAEA